MTILHVIFLILWIVYCCKGINRIYQIIYDILKMKDLYSNIKNNNNISIYEQSSKSKIQIKVLKFSTQNSKSKINEIKNRHPKKEKTNNKKSKNNRNKRKRFYKEQTTSKNKIEEGKKIKQVKLM